MYRDEIDSFFILDVISNILQIANYEMNVKEVSNDEIMKMLELQNKEYLDSIKKDIADLKAAIVEQGGKK